MSTRPVKSRVLDLATTPRAREAAPARTASAPSPFIGRERELAEMRAALEAAWLGSGRVLHVIGEAGIGKTRLAGELERRARERGFRVLAGRCREEPGAPAYWPWVQVMRAHAAGRDPKAVRADLGSWAADIVQILPALREDLHELRAAPPGDPEQARFRAFDGVVLFLRRIAQEQPLLLVLDDLHWADPASLGLLTFLVQEVSDARIVVLCTSREEDVRRSEPLSRAVAELARHDWVLRVPLGGLTQPEVGRYVAAVASYEPSDALVERVHQVTEGNPLFVTEVVRLLAAEDGTRRDAERALAIPETVRAVIRQRLDRLARDTVDLLQIAAIIGREFDLALLERVARADASVVIAAIEEALAARILAEVRTHPGRCRFSHALVRETLQDELAVSRRLDLHRRVGEALEERLAANRESHLAELAHHFWSCAPGGDPAKAVRYLVEAAGAAAASLAHEEAAATYERALQLLEESGADDARRCEVLLLASECHWRAGDAARARRGFAAAAKTASRLGLRELLARAALGFAGPIATQGTADVDALRFLDEALRLLPPAETPLRARVLARLAMEACYADDRQQGRALTDDALAMARRVGDPETLALAIGARRQLASIGDDAVARLAELDDLVCRAEEVSDGWVEMLARHWRLIDLLHLADMPRLERELETFARLAQERRDALSLYRASALRATLALLQGRFEDHARLAQDFLARGQRVSPENALQAFYAQQGFVEWLRGRPEASIAVAEPIVRDHPGLPAWRAALAALYADAGRPEDARREIDRMAVDDFAALPQTFFRVPAAALLAHAAWSLDDAPHAAKLHELLAPHSGRNIVVGFGAAAYGAADVYLGMTSAAAGDWDRAAAELEAGIALDERMGARPFAAQGRYAYARVLLSRGARGDRERAHEAIADARRTALELGLATLLAKLDALGARAADRPTDERQGSVPADAVAATFRKEGEYWAIGTDAALLRLKDTIGLRCLAQLLQHPGREMLALDLASAARGASRADVGVERPASDPQLDARARGSYRERLEELRGELEEARANNDVGRVQRAQEEIAAVTRELERALGFGGRVRSQSVPASERARQNVTRAIWNAVRRIGAHDSRLGAHLDKTVRTGTFCSYEPPAGARLLWRF
ncbi:MAG: AAA family ATPase [Thermodesulfobacteriota bacterium]